MERDTLKAEVQFVRQLGFAAEDGDNSLYAALMFQPRCVGVIVAVGILAQSAWIFLALGAALWWSTIVPRWNLFDVAYNGAVRRPNTRGIPPETPAPRRFSQAMAGSAALTIGVTLVAGAPAVAWVLQGLIAAGSAVVVFGRRCAPAVVYQVLRCRLAALGVTAARQQDPGCAPDAAP